MLLGNYAVQRHINLLRCFLSKILPKSEEEKSKKGDLAEGMKEVAAQFEGHSETIKSLDIKPCALPMFQSVISQLFKEPDKRYLKDIQGQAVRGNDKRWYRSFLSDWRAVPEWYTYDHDVLLMELVLRNGTNTERILADLMAEESRAAYMTRLKSQFSNTWDDPYYAFKTWIKSKWNVLHRLKYVTDTMVGTLYGAEQEGDPSKFTGCCVLFTEYQRRSHTGFLRKKRKTIGRDEWKKKAIEDPSFDANDETAAEDISICSGIISCLSCPKSEREVEDISSPAASQRSGYEPLAHEDREESANGLHGSLAGSQGASSPSSRRSIGSVSSNPAGLHNVSISLRDSRSSMRRPGRIKRHSTVFSQQMQISFDEVLNSFVHITNDVITIAVSVGPSGSQHFARFLSNPEDTIKTVDPFVERDIRKELSDVFQIFNLHRYGRPLAKLILKQMQKRHRPSQFSNAFSSMSFIRVVTTVHSNSSKYFGFWLLSI